MPRAIANTRLRKLLIVLATVAFAAVIYHAVDYRLTGQSSIIAPITRHFYNLGPNYSEIEKGLWMGGYVPQPPPGTQAVLNLCESTDPYKVLTNRVDAIPDGPPAPNIDWLDRQVAFIESERSAGHTVYVHCMAGISRSGTVMAAYYMRRNGWTADQAIQFLKSKRPAVNPNPVFGPLLAEWERRVKRTPATEITTQP